MVASASQVIEKSFDPARLRTLFDAQRAAYNTAPYPSLKARRATIARLRKAVVAREDDYLAAVTADFGNRSGPESMITELMTFVETARYASRNLRRWMKPSHRDSGLLMAGTRSQVVYQPLGVVGILAPWNYPFLMVMRPLVYALAAGNRAMIKPSEITPRSAEFMRELIEDTFAPEEVAVVTGEADLAAAFTQLPFDHMLFTGSTEVGRHVMRAAAENLTPVTLELGGKSPTVIAADANLTMAAERICFAKSINAGQTCVAPDYVLVPHHMEEEFVAKLKTAYTRMFPESHANEDYTSIVNQRMYERQRQMLDDAAAKGGTIVELGGPSCDTSRRHPLTILTNVSNDMMALTEEIFGPLLPIVHYDSEDEVIDCINARPRRLALNVFTKDKAFQQRMITETHSGGLSFNDAVTYLGVDDLPFGGVGASGMGRYLGEEGFITFSNAKAVFRRPTMFNSSKTLHAPYGGTAYRLVRKLFFR